MNSYTCDSRLQSSFLESLAFLLHDALPQDSPTVGRLGGRSVGCWMEISVYLSGHHRQIRCDERLYITVMQSWKLLRWHLPGSHQQARLHPGHGIHCCKLDRLTVNMNIILRRNSCQVWISPVVANLDTSTPYGLPYHGYWAQDIYSINPQFGTSADLVALSNALHTRGMVSRTLPYPPGQSH